jgi:hypothetical protein
VRLEQGVVDTNVEAVLLGGQAGAVSAAEPLKRMSAGDTKWLTLRSSAGKAGLGNAQVPDDARAAIARDLAAGYTVIVPQRPVEIAGRTAYAWWRVDEQTGQTLGMTTAGGATFVEYALIVSFGLATGVWTYIGCGGGAAGASGGKKLGCAICAVAMAAIAMLSLGVTLEVGGAIAAGGKALGTVGGVLGAGMGGMACNALSGFAS